MNPLNTKKKLTQLDRDSKKRSKIGKSLTTGGAK